MTACRYCGHQTETPCTTSRDVEDRAESGSVKCLYALDKDRSLGEVGYERVLLRMKEKQGARAEIIRRLRAGETGHGIDVGLAKLLHPDDVHVPSYSASVDAALAAPIADGWVISGVTRNSRGWFAEAEAGAGGVGAECGEAPALAAAIMIAKLLTFNGGGGKDDQPHRALRPQHAAGSQPRIPGRQCVARCRACAAEQSVLQGPPGRIASGVGGRLARRKRQDERDGRGVRQAGAILGGVVR